MWLRADVFRTSSCCSLPRSPSVGEGENSASNMVRNIETTLPQSTDNRPKYTSLRGSHRSVEASSLTEQPSVRYGPREPESPGNSRESTLGTHAEMPGVLCPEGSLVAWHRSFIRQCVCVGWLLGSAQTGCAQHSKCGRNRMEREGERVGEKMRRGKVKITLPLGTASTHTHTHLAVCPCLSPVCVRRHRG